MASTLTAVINALLNGTEVLDTTDAPYSSAESDRRINVNGLNETVNLSATSTPALEKAPLVQQITISGTTTIDLTAAPLTGERTEDMTAKKLIALQLKADKDNSGDVTVAPGSANPYPLFGAGNEVDLEPGEAIMLFISGVASGKPAVSGTVKNIDITGTNDDVLDVILYFGT